MGPRAAGLVTEPGRRADLACERQATKHWGTQWGTLGRVSWGATVGGVL